MRFHRRIQKLEEHFFDANRLVAYSREWFAHWEGKIDRLLAGENPDLGGLPLTVVDSIIEAAEAAQ
jgi:hypothetical protein